MNDSWIDKLEAVKTVNELLELMKRSPTADDLHRTHDLMTGLIIAIIVLAIVLGSRNK